LSFSCVVNIRNECYAFDAKKIEVDLMTLTLKLFANVSCKEVENAFIKHHDELVSSYVNNVEKIRDLAISCEHYSLKEARRLMQMALKLRPEGPRIIEKLKYYDNELANSGIC